MALNSLKKKKLKLDKKKGPKFANWSLKCQVMRRFVTDWWARWWVRIPGCLPRDRNDHKHTKNFKPCVIIVGLKPVGFERGNIHTHHYFGKIQKEGEAGVNKLQDFG